MPRYLTGRKIPFLEGTDYGIIHLVRVKNVSVRRLSFGIESNLLPRITGEVNADFLPLTTDRNDFIRETPEFEIFSKVMERIIVQVKEELSRQSDEKENTRLR